MEVPVTVGDPTVPDALLLEREGNSVLVFVPVLAVELKRELLEQFSGRNQYRPWHGKFALL